MTLRGLSWPAYKGGTYGELVKGPFVLKHAGCCNWINNFFENTISNLQILTVGLVRLVGTLDLRVALVGQRYAGARVASVNLKRKLPFGKCGRPTASE